MVALPLPTGMDGAALKTRLYNDYRIEIPFTEWKGQSFLRISIQGYNSQEDIEVLMDALRKLL